MTAVESATGGLSRAHVRYAAALAFAGLALLVTGFYYFMRAPVLDPLRTLDPWIYTASFTNYHYLLHTYPGAYYLTRLPWIIPGVAANAVLAPVPAFFALHAVFFFAAALFAFLLFRRFLGVEAALLGCAALMLTPLFYDAYSNDYPDGAILTYLFAGTYFGIGAWGSGAGWRAVRFVLAGFCLAGAEATNLFSVVTIGGIGLFYVVVFSVGPRFWLRMLGDIACAALGALLMLAACGAFSIASGGPFLFFMPSIEFARAIRLTDYKLHGYEWLRGQPQLLVPLFALVVLVPLVIPRLRRWQADAAVRFAAGSAVFLAYLVAVIGIWEFANNGDFLELPYYFSVFNLVISCALASAFYLLFWDGRTASSPRARRSLVAAGIVTAALPTFILYRLHQGSFGESGARLTIVLMVLGLALVAAACLRSRRMALPVAFAAVLGVLFAANYAAASSRSTHGIFATTSSTYRERTETLSLGMQLISFLKENGFQDPVAAIPGANPVPSFWYNDHAEEAFTGMNSLYLWGYTWVGLDLPHVDAAMKKVLEDRRPAVLVLFCLTRPCDGARAALTGAGYANRPIVERLLASGDKHAWAIAVQLLKFRKPL